MFRVLERILESPRVYAAWQAPFVAQKFAPAERHIRWEAVRRVLDVGCGPGTNAGRFRGCEYVGVDINPRYLEIARRSNIGTFIHADLAHDSLDSLGGFDTILINSFLHHLPDAHVNALLGRLREMLTPDGAVHILELVRPDRWSLATPMARLDRGRHARPINVWASLVRKHFDVVVTEPYTFGGRLWAMVYIQGRLR